MVRTALMLAILTVILGGCGGGGAVQVTLTEIASSARMWTGVTCDRDGRMFVNYPRWSHDVPVSVAELVDGQPVPYPDERWNSWTPGADPTEAFVCVQSLVADGRGSLWVLDPGNPLFGGIVPGGPKLVRFELATGEVVRIYRFAEPVITHASYLNDVRIDLAAGTAYITDSGDGALIVVDLAGGQARRLLDHHRSTQAEDVMLTIEGKPWAFGGVKPQVHSDGLALCPARRHLYFQALTGRTLYRVPTLALRNQSLTEGALAEQVEAVGQTGAADGLIFGADGLLYISSLEESAIKTFDPDTRKTRIVVQDPRIRWPDTFTVDPQGRVLFTTTQVHLGDKPVDPYRIFRLDPIAAVPR